MIKHENGSVTLTAEEYDELVKLTMLRIKIEPTPIELYGWGEKVERRGNMDKSDTHE